MGVLMGVRTGDVSHQNFRGARFVQVGTRKGSAFTSSEERERGFGSVFRHHNLKSQPLSVGIFFVRSASVGAVSGSLPRARFRPHIQYSCGFAGCGL